MFYNDQMANAGNSLFRWRSYVPIIFFSVLLLSMKRFEYLGKDHTLDLIWEGGCLIISFLGLAIRCLTVGFTPHNTSGRNTKEQVAAALNTTGAYSIVRNPLYLGNFVIWLGISMFHHDWIVVLSTTCIFWIYYERIIIAEEKYLEEKFGVIYKQWALRTPAFVPRFYGYIRPNQRFSYRKVLRKEYSGFFAIIITMFTLEIVGDMFYTKGIVIDIYWLIAVTLGAVVYISLRTLKKKTRILK